jgi:[ribosomal protein S5]-alanine N-acetyltransferase
MNLSNRLVFDRPVKDDFERFYAIHSDPQTNLFNPAGPMNREKATTVFADLLTHWHTHQFGVWQVRLHISDTVIGFGGLDYRMYGDELKLNLGYRFDTAYWGKGYATELSQYAICFGFETLQVNKIYALVRPRHLLSINVLEKCGLKHCGVLNDVPGEEWSLVFCIEQT